MVSSECSPLKTMTTAIKSKLGPRRGTQLAALHIIEELPQLFYQLLSLAGIKQDSLVSAAHALQSALKNADSPVLDKIDVEAVSGDTSVVAHNVVLEMEIKVGGSTVVRIKPVGRPRDNAYMLLGNGVLHSQTNVRALAPASEGKEIES